MRDVPAAELGDAVTAACAEQGCAASSCPPGCRRRGARADVELIEDDGPDAPPSWTPSTAP